MRSIRCCVDRIKSRRLLSDLLRSSEPLILVAGDEEGRSQVVRSCVVTARANGGKVVYVRLDQDEIDERTLLERIREETSGLAAAPPGPSRGADLATRPQPISESHQAYAEIVLELTAFRQGASEVLLVVDGASALPPLELFARYLIVDEPRIRIVLADSDEWVGKNFHRGAFVDVYPLGAHDFVTVAKEFLCRHHRSDWSRHNGWSGLFGEVVGKAQKHVDNQPDPVEDGYYTVERIARWMRMAEPRHFPAFPGGAR